VCAPPPPPVNSPILNVLFVLLASIASHPVTPRARQTPAVTVTGASDVPPDVVAAVRRLTLDALEWFAPTFPSRSSPFSVEAHRSEASLPAEVRRHLHAGTAGVAMLASQRIHLILDRCGVEPPNDLRTVVRHEVVHILLSQHAGPNVPRWFHEGLAQSLAGGTYLGVSEEDLVFYARTGNLFRFSQLRHRFPSRPTALRKAYAQSYSFVSFLQRRAGLQELLDAAAHCGPERDYFEAFRLRVGRPLVVLEEEWNEYVKTGSGAGWRVMLTSCFALLMVAALPLLVLAGKGRWMRDLRSRRRLEVEDSDDLDDGGGSGRAHP